MAWNINFTKKASKQLAKLPSRIQDSVEVLVLDLGEQGALPKNWPHCGKLKGSKNLYHCHLNKGRPTYVACWEVVDKKIKLVEVYYVGTHEKAPY